jgi:hypothetical protein
MPRYMLDTDTCSYITKRSHDRLLRRLAKIPVSDVCIRRVRHLAVENWTN